MFDDTFKKIFNTLVNVNEISKAFNVDISYKFEADKVKIFFKWRGLNTTYEKTLTLEIDKKKIGWKSLETDIKKITQFIKDTYERPN